MRSPLLRHGFALLAVLLLPAAARASADVTPPAMVSLGFAPGAIDVSSSSQSIGITVQATDDSSGVDSIYGVFESPSGKSTVPFSMTNANIVGGTPLNGVYNCAVNFSACNEPGAWSLASVIVTDQCGNTAAYAASASASTLAYPNGTPAALLITNSNPDTALPSLTSFTFSPSGVDLTGTGNTITVTAVLSDTTAGVDSGYFAFTSSSGSQIETGTFNSSNLISGDQYSGTYQTTVTFPGCDAPGNWNLASVSVSDPCGSTATYGPGSQAYPNGTPTVVAVTNPNSDITPPQLVGASLSSTLADVTNGEVQVDGTAVATDNLSGVYQGAGYYMNASGKYVLTMSFSASGTSPELSGTFATVMNVPGCAPPGVYTLKSFDLYDQCGNEAQYGGSNAPFPAGTTNSFLVVNGTQATGSVEVILYPPSAEYAGQWYLDTDTGFYHYSGTAVTGLSPGSHTLYFNPAPGYTAPATQSLTVAANQTLYASGTYVSMNPEGSLQVNLAGGAPGAEWDVDNGPLQAGGATVSGLSDGSHTVTFTTVSGYTSPATEAVETGSGATTILTGTYAQITEFGSVTAAIEPEGAIANGGKWNIDGSGPSESSGATASGIPIGEHSVNFTTATGYNSPPSQEVMVDDDGLVSVTGTYTALASSTGSLTVDISPSAAIKAGARWSLDDGPPEKSGTKLNGVSGGNHTVAFTMLPGDVTPGPLAVSVVPGGSITVTGTYTKAPGFSGAAEIFAGITPAGNAFLSLSMTDKGKFTGKLAVTGSSTYSLAGTFDHAGYYSGQAGAARVPYVLQVTGSTPGTYQLTGSAAGIEVTAYPASYTRGQAVAELGKYTALLTGTGAGIPQGTGYATVTIGSAGAGSVVGKLADGTSFSASSLLVSGTGGHGLIVYEPAIYNKKGLLSGVLNFGPPGEFQGTLLWNKPETTGTYYPGPIDSSLAAEGVRLDNAIAFTSGTVNFTGGGLLNPVAEPFSITAGRVVLSGTADKVKLAIKASTGALSGSFQPAGAAKALGFSGVLLEDGTLSQGAGYFLNPAGGLSGNVTLP